MGTYNSTLINTEESRAGAMACVNAMRIIERIENNPMTDCSMEDWWLNKEAEITAMLQAAGVQDGFMAGFVATFAEYVSTVESTGTPNPHSWKPQTTMTDEEKAIYQASFDEGVKEVCHE